MSISMPYTPIEVTNIPNLDCQTFLESNNHVEWSVMQTVMITVQNGERMVIFWNMYYGE